MNLLNLNTPEDIYELMNDVAEEARGGSLDDCSHRQLELMQSYRNEIVTSAKSEGSPEWLQAALSYLLEMVDLCCHLGEDTEELRLLVRAKSFAKLILEHTEDLEDFQQLCRVHRRYLDTLWYKESELSGKTTCTYLLEMARKWYAAHPEWDEEGFLEELAKIYGVNAKWFGMYRNVQDRNGAWHTLCMVRSGKIRLYLDQLRCRRDLENLRQNLFDTADRYMDEYGMDWDPRQARSCLIQVLNLMKRNPKLPFTPYLMTEAYDRIAQTYEAEEKYAQAKRLEFSAQKRIASRTKAKDYRLKAMDAWLNFLRNQQRKGQDTDIARMCLRDCYEALAEDFSCLPGEKNAAKAKKYRQKAEDMGI